MNKFFKYIGVGTLALSMGSCNDFLDQYSQDLVVAKSVHDLNELLVGDVYLKSHEVNDGPSQRPLGFINILDDDINVAGTSSKGQVGNKAYRSVVRPLFGYLTWQQDVRYNYGRTASSEDNGTWNTFYQRIAHANSIIDIIDEMPQTTDKDKEVYHRVRGEAHFARAQFYFYLANLYGQPYRPDSAATDLCVPLKLTPEVVHNKDNDTQFKRHSVKEVYEQIVADLLVAEEELTTAPQQARYRLHRASAEAAALLLSRTYLYMQAWDKAEAAAKRVLDSKKHTLTTLSELAASQAFLTPANREVIFSQGANHITVNSERTSLSGDAADLCVSRDLYNLYADEDVRKAKFFAIQSTTDSVGLANKYGRVEVNHISDGMMLRLSEAYLNYAEALAMQGKSSEANATLRTLREQRISHYAPEDYTDSTLVSEIRLERRRELCFEGHRWFDLRRYAVNALYPYSKPIVRAFSSFNDNAVYVTTDLYILPPGDPNYVFAIPHKVLEFDKVAMPQNERVVREAYRDPNSIPTLDDILNDSTSNDSAGGGARGFYF